MGLLSEKYRDKVKREWEWETKGRHLWTAGPQSDENAHEREKEKEEELTLTRRSQSYIHPEVLYRVGWYEVATCGVVKAGRTLLPLHLFPTFRT